MSQPLLGVEWTFLQLETGKVEEEQIKEREAREAVCGTEPLLDWPTKNTKKDLNCPPSIFCHSDLERGLRSYQAGHQHWTVTTACCLPCPSSLDLKINNLGSYISLQTRLTPPLLSSWSGRVRQTGGVTLDHVQPWISRTVVVWCEVWGPGLSGCIN